MTFISRRGVKRPEGTRQRLQIVYRWRYLVLAVDGRAGRLWRVPAGGCWDETMQAADLLAAVDALKDQTPLAALVWDRAPSHRDAQIRALGLPLIEQPPYSPELNPAERVFEHLRAQIEGTVSPPWTPRSLPWTPCSTTSTRIPPASAPSPAGPGSPITCAACQQKKRHDHTGLV